MAKRRVGTADYAPEAEEAKDVRTSLEKVAAECSVESNRADQERHRTRLKAPFWLRHCESRRVIERTSRVHEC